MTEYYYYSAIEENEVLSFVITCMCLEGIMLSRQILYDFT